MGYALRKAVSNLSDPGASRGATDRAPYGLGQAANDNTPRPATRQPAPRWLPMNPPANDNLPSNNPRHWISNTRNVAPAPYVLPKSAGQLLRLGGRALPLLGAALTVWELYELYRQFATGPSGQPGVRGLPNGWNASCSGACGSRSSSYHDFTAQQQHPGAITPACGYANICLGGQAPPPNTTFNDAGFNVGQTAFTSTIPSGKSAFTYVFFGGRWFFGNRRLQYWDAWVMSGPTTSQAYPITINTVGNNVPQSTLPQPFRSPQLEPLPSLPVYPGSPTLPGQSPSSPHRTLPDRVPSVPVLPAFEPWKYPPAAPSPLPVPVPVPLAPYLPELDPAGEPLRGPRTRPRVSPRRSPGRTPSRDPKRARRTQARGRNSRVPSRQVMWKIGPAGQRAVIANRNGSHKLKPPPKNEKQVKGRPTSAALKAAQWAINIASESCDVVDALYGALPFSVTRKYERKQARYGSYKNWQNYQQRQKSSALLREGAGGLGCHSKAIIVASNAGSLDLGLAFANLVGNQIIDYVGGRIGKALGKAGREHGSLVGFGTGPTF
jgi:hypothetical protein